MMARGACLLLALVLALVTACVGLDCGRCPPPLPPGFASRATAARERQMLAGGSDSEPADDEPEPFRRLLVSLAYYHGPSRARASLGLPPRVEHAQCDDNLRFFYRHALNPATTDVVVSVIGNSLLPPPPLRGSGVTFRRHACNGGIIEELVAHATLLFTLRSKGALNKYSHFVLMSCAARGPYVLSDPSACPAAFEGWQSESESGPRWLYPFSARLRRSSNSDGGRTNASSSGMAALIGPTISFEGGRFAHVPMHFAVTTLPHIDRVIFAIRRKRKGQMTAAGGCGGSVDGARWASGGQPRGDRYHLDWIDTRPPSVLEQQQDMLAIGQGAKLAPLACAHGSERDWSSHHAEPIACALGRASAASTTLLTAQHVGSSQHRRAVMDDGASTAAAPAAARDSASPIRSVAAATALAAASPRSMALLGNRAARLSMDTEVFISQLTLHDGFNIGSLLPSQQGWDFRRCAYSREPPSRAALVSRNLDQNPALTSRSARPFETVFVLYGGKLLAESTLHGLLCGCLRSAEELDGTMVKPPLLQVSFPRNMHPPLRVPRGKVPFAAREIERTSELPRAANISSGSLLLPPRSRGEQASPTNASASAAARWVTSAELWDAEQKSAQKAQLDEYKARNERVPRLDRVPPCEEDCPACEPFARAVLPVRVTEQPAEYLTTAEIAISQCSYPLDFLPQVVADIEGRNGRLHLTRITAYLKCGQTPAVPVLPASSATMHVQRLPNVGRCDHTWAHHFAENYATLADVVLLLKDSHFVYPIERLRALAVGVTDALEQTRMGGFACFRSPELSPSRWHMRQEVMSFRMARYASAALLSPAAATAARDRLTSSNNARFTSPYDMFQFLAKALDEEELLRLLEQDIVPVCYGGTFSVTRRRVHSVSLATFERLRSLMDRGVDSIEEGHYMERAWAALLAPAMTPVESAAFQTGVGGDFWLRPEPGVVPTKGHGSQGNTYGGLVKRCCCERLKHAN